MMDADIRQHFPKQEHAFISHIEDLIDRCQAIYALQLTEFLNPRQISIVKNLCQRADLKCFASTEHWPSEFGRCLIAPDYYELDSQDFEMVLLEINYPAKFGQLTHPKIMGTLIGQLGIKRTVLGDIVLNGTRAQLMLDRQLMHYCQERVTKIAGIGVTLTEVPFTELLISDDERLEIDLLVSSLRLDKIVAAVYKLSRSDAIKLIQSDKVKVNYAPVIEPDSQLVAHDLVSVRGYGRFVFTNQNGFSKSGKHKIVVERIL